VIRCFLTTLVASDEAEASSAVEMEAQTLVGTPRFNVVSTIQTT
ncbi:uncharacterized protein METZ01_LOCUS508460, partial [marine metagenome]